MFAALDRLKVRFRAQQLEVGAGKGIKKQTKPTEIHRGAGDVIRVFKPEALL